jgi:hypothetical protein
MEGVFQQLWTALDRVLPLLDEPWRRIIGVGVPAAFVLVAFFMLFRLAFRPVPKTAPLPLRDTIADRVSKISHFMRHDLPSRLDSPKVARDTQVITKELLQELTELRKLNFRMTKSQAERSEAFIQIVVSGVNELIVAIKKQAESTTPDVSQVNATLKTVTDRVDRSGQALVNLFD